MNALGWVALSLTGHIGLKTLCALQDHFGSIPAVFEANAAELQQVAGVGPKIAQSIVMLDLPAIALSIQRWREAGVEMIPATDARYPARLHDLPDAPATLFVRGNWLPDDSLHAAIIGTRQPSAQGTAVAQALAFKLAAEGYTIVSGLALGIDRQAHQGALLATGRTVAVLGSGVLRIYPQQHYNLAQQIEQAGALVSEVAPTASPSSVRLVARNRIISGLSNAVFVVETATDGGAMHAARRAREQGRPLYVLDCDASGNRALLDDGVSPFRADLSDLFSP